MTENNNDRIELSSNTCFIRYTTREEFDHYNYLVVEEKTTTKYSYTVSHDAMEGINGEMVSSIKALGSGLEVTVGGNMETTDGTVAMSVGEPTLQLNENTDLFETFSRLGLKY